MNKLNKLIAELCPDGVEYKELNEILTIKNGSDYKSFESGNVPVYGSGGIMTYVDRFAYDKPSVLIPRKGSIDKLYYVDTPFWNVDTIFYTIINTDIALPRYVYHCLLREHLEKYNTAGGVPSLTQKVLNKVIIPVPPLPVQNEIVRILDNFTELTVELEKKLTAELAARRKQYEYYRNELLKPKSNIGIRSTLGDCCFLKAGKAISAIEISDCKNSHYPIDCYGANGHRGYVKTGNQTGNHSLIGRQGALCGNVCYASGNFYATEHAIVVSHNGCFDDRYLFHLLTAADLNQYKTAGAQPGLSVARLEKVEVFIPSIELQKKIALVLDNFESICSDLNIGLPAEIEARKKQYEFYRDILLTFAETGTIIAQTDRQTDRFVN